MSVGPFSSVFRPCARRAFLSRSEFTGSSAAAGIRVEMARPAGAVSCFDQRRNRVSDRIAQGGRVEPGLHSPRKRQRTYPTALMARQEPWTTAWLERPAPSAAILTSCYPHKLRARGRSCAPGACHPATRIRESGLRPSGNSRSCHDSAFAWQCNRTLCFPESDTG